tara:strand:- start:370 stop:564 length:195 start_codon:yes stop_codon:yes gene_type:complete
MAKVKFNGGAPGSAPKAAAYADIKDQGRIPYGKDKVLPQKHTYPRLTARGMGAARRGGKYTACI